MTATRVRVSRSTTRQFLQLTGPDGAGLPHFVALDGLRGLAVAGVLLYHCGFSVMTGGFLGVSTFFTLSGFLITSLLLRAASDGRVDLAGFWSKRLRRLLPASLVTVLAVVTLFAVFVATVDQRSTLLGDAWASLAQVLNWRFIVEDTRYGALFAAPSPLLHFWSLAIEEQLYLVLPVVVVVVWRATGGRLRQMGLTLGGLAVLSAALPLLFTMSDDRVYFGTDTRAAELLWGAVLAVAFAAPAVRRALARNTTVRGTVALAGAVVLVLQLATWWTTEQSASWLYHGGFSVYALGSVVVITACTLPSGPLRSLLAGPALTWLGRRSYAIYLFHWPIFLTFRQLVPELGALPRAVVGISVTLVLAEVSHRVLEQPIRRGRWPRPRVAPRLAVASILAVALIAFVVLRDPPEAPVDFETAAESYDSLPTVSTVPPAPDAPPDAPPVPTVMTFGDSTSLFTAMGMATWGRETGRLVDVGGDSEMGCAITRFAEARFDKDLVPAPSCTDWPETWPGLLDQQQPLMVQIVNGTWEVPDVRLSGSDEFSSIGDPEVDAFVVSELTQAVDLLASRGALVVLVLVPEVGGWGLPDLPAYRAQAEPARMDRYHELQRQVAAARPDTVRVLDLDGHLGDRAQDRELRPDGTHIDADGMLEIYREWMGAETVRLFDEWWAAHHGGGTPEGAAAQSGGS